MPVHATGLIARACEPMVVVGPAAMLAHPSRALAPLPPTLAARAADQEAGALVEQPSEPGTFWEKTLWVGGIPEYAANQSYLQGFFSGYGEVQSVVVRFKPAATRSWAVVTFKSAASATM